MQKLTDHAVFKNRFTKCIFWLYVIIVLVKLHLVFHIASYFFPLLNPLSALFFSFLFFFYFSSDLLTPTIHSCTLLLSLQTFFPLFPLTSKVSFLLFFLLLSIVSSLLPTFLSSFLLFFPLLFLPFFFSSLLLYLCYFSYSLLFSFHFFSSSLLLFLHSFFSTLLWLLTYYLTLSFLSFLLYLQ